MSPVVAYPPALRADYLARLRINLRAARVPGGDLSTWLARVPTAALAEVLARPREQTLELLFAARGMACGIPPADVEADLSRAPSDNLALGFLAFTVRYGWRTLTEARDAIEAGEPRRALEVLNGLTRWLPDLPASAARRFEPTLCALWAEADALRERHLADEVA